MTPTRYRVLRWFGRKIGVHLCARCVRVAVAMTVRMELLTAPRRTGTDEHGNTLH